MLRPLLSSAFAGLVLLASIVVVPGGGCAATTGSTGPLVNCTPRNYVYCTCQDRASGTKLCNDDGHSFGPCDPCESSTNPATPDDPHIPPVKVDAGEDATTRPPATCGDKLVQAGEDCDDGNKVEDDGCDSKCRLAGTNPLASRSCPGMEVHVWSQPVTYVGTTLGSTNTGTAKPTCPGINGSNPTTGAAAPDRVFKVVAHKTGKMTVATTDTNYDSFLYVTSACTPGPNGELTYLACMNGVNGTGGEALEFPVTEGATYSVLVDGAGISQQQGAFRVTFSIP